MIFEDFLDFNVNVTVIWGKHWEDSRPRPQAGHFLPGGTVCAPREVGKCDIAFQQFA